MCKKEFKEIIINGDRDRVICVTDGDYPSDVKKLIGKPGIEIVDSTPDEFVADYERRYGKPDLSGFNPKKDLKK